MPKNPDKIYPTLEGIVSEARVAEDEVNLCHPERHGTGLTLEEAQPFIRQLNYLDFLEEQSQRKKVSSRVGRICMTGQCQLYYLSPEDMVIRGEDLKEIRLHINNLCHNLTEEEREIYNEYYLDKRSQRDIAIRNKVHQSTISRAITKINGLLSFPCGGNEVA